MRKRWGSFPVAIPGDVDDRLDDCGNSIRGTGIGHPG